jgi:hypothetical protein
MSILEAISPTAHALLNGGAEQYQFDVTIRYSCGAHVARCHGRTASSTNSAEIAASAAALKHWNRFLGTSGVNGSLYTLTVKPSGIGMFKATFKRKAAQ